MAWCDLDHDGRDKVPGEPYVCEVNGLRRDIDLCPEHATTLTGYLLDMLTKYGREPDRPAKRKRSRRAVPVEVGFSCPECGQAFSTPQGRGAHRYRAHGYRRPAKTS